MLEKLKFELGKLMELNSEGSSCEKLLGVRQRLKLNKLMDIIPSPRICLNSDF